MTTEHLLKTPFATLIDTRLNDEEQQKGERKMAKERIDGMRGITQISLKLHPINFLASSLFDVEHAIAMTSAHLKQSRD